MTVGIVGAGITGLSLAHHLDDGGREFVVFEASARPGGVIGSERVDSHLVERGPHRIRRTGAVDELIGDMGLDDAVITAADDLPLYVYHRGELRVVPRSVGEFVRTDLVSARGKLRALVEPFAGTARDDEMAADLFRRKFGDEVYRNVVEPLFSGIYASDPERMPARYSLSGLLDLDEREGSLLGPALARLTGDDAAPPISFEDGQARLPRALYRAHADRINLSTPVSSVHPSDGRYRVDADGEHRVVDDVVVTAPAGEAAAVLAEVAPDAADRLHRLRYNPVVMVYLEATDPVDVDGLGFQVHRDEDLRTSGVTFVDDLFERENLYTAFFGGMRDPGVTSEPTEVLESTAVREFETVLGVPAEPIGVNRLSAYPAYDESWRALDGLSLPDGVYLATNYTARIGVPGRIREARQLAKRLAP